jgi:outer membrane protein TolC
MHAAPTRRQRLIFSLFLLLSPASVRTVAATESVLSLPLALEETLQGSPELKRWRASAEAQQWQVNRAATRFLPTLALEGGHVFAFRFSTEATGATPNDAVVELKFPLTDVGGVVTLPIFDGLQNLRRLAATHLELDATRSDETWAAFVLLRQVRYAFRHALAAQQIEQAARQDVDTLMSHRQQIENMRDQGAATDFDVLRVDVSYANAKTAVLRAEDETFLARRKLAELMGLQTDPRRLDGDLPQPEPQMRQRVAALDTTALPARSDLDALLRKAEAQDRLRAAAAAFWIPKLEAAASGSLYNNWDRSIDRTSLFSPAYSVGVRMRWNIFDGGQALAEAGVHTAAERTLRHRLEAAQLAQGYALEEGKRDYLYAAELYVTRTLNIQRAEQNLTIAMAGLRNGTRDSTDVLDAEQDLFASRAGAIEALLSVERSCIKLELALGHAL